MIGREKQERRKWGRKESGLRSKLEDLVGCKTHTFIWCKVGFDSSSAIARTSRSRTFDGDVTKSREDSRRGVGLKMATDKIHMDPRQVECGEECCGDEARIAILRIFNFEISGRPSGPPAFAHRNGDLKMSPLFACLDVQKSSDYFSKTK